MIRSSKIPLHLLYRICRLPYRAISQTVQIIKNLRRKPSGDSISSQPHNALADDDVAVERGFARLHDEGVDPVVARLTMSFKTPLRSGDEFISKLYLKKEGIKYVFYQDIFRASDMKMVIKATVETVCLVNGRLSGTSIFDQVFAPYLNE